MSYGAGDFLAGVIEGFYGQPWTRAERLQLFESMAATPLRVYLYAPKDDLHHRTLWREPYGDADAGELRGLITACRQRGVRFLYGIGPGLDIDYSSAADVERLQHRCAQMRELGCDAFAVLFDDIPDTIDPFALSRWGSLAAAQAHVTNALFGWLGEGGPEPTLLFCPTPYCGRMAAAQLGGPGYLEILGRTLHHGIHVFWTGPDIVSREITVAHVRDLQSLLRRKVLIWDNLHANDYDGRRFYCGPYAGRPLELRGEVAGILTNPNNELPLNYVPLRTLAAFLTANGAWDARRAYLEAMEGWLPSFDTVRERAALEDLLLLGDCYYLPYEEGPRADALYARVDALVNRRGAEAKEDVAAVRRDVARLRDFCARLAELRDRPLFYALSRRIWDLREELDLLDRFLAADPARGDEVRSDFHRPGTYRGGMVARLQRLLVQRPDGAFVPAGADPSAGGDGAAPGMPAS